MASVTAVSPWGAPGPETSLPEPPKKSYDDGMYHPYNIAPPAAADRLNEPSWQPKQKGQDAVPNLPAPDATRPGELGKVAPAPLVSELPAANLQVSNQQALNQQASNLPAANLQSEQVDHPLPPTPTVVLVTSTMTSSTSSSTESSSSTSTSTTSTTHRTTLHTTSLPTTTHSGLSATDTSPIKSPASTSASSDKLAPGAEAGIAIGVLGLAFIMIGLIFWRLNRKKRAFQMAIRGEKNPLPPKKQGPMYNLASNLYTKSTLTLVSIAEVFKPSDRNSLHSIDNSNSSIYSTHPAPSPIAHQGGIPMSSKTLLWKDRAHRVVVRVHSAIITAANTTREKVNQLSTKQKPPVQRRSRHAHEYGFSEEFLHIPPPEPQPPRLPKALSQLCANSSSTIRTVTEKFKPTPPEKDNPFSTSSSMSSRHLCSESSTQQEEYVQQFPTPCEIIADPDLFRVRSVSSGTVAMSNPADISVDALAGRISEEQEENQHSPPKSPPQPAPVHLPVQPEVSSMKPWSIQMYRVDMPFSSRSTGHLEVSEGQLALCTVAETDIQGLIPRACLSTWPIKDRRHYATSHTGPDRWQGSTASVSPVDSQSFRFYRQHSQPGTPKTELEAFSPTLSAVTPP